MDGAPPPDGPPVQKSPPDATGGGFGRPGAMRAGGVDRRLLEGPILPTLVLFSLPMLGGNVLMSLNATVNQFFVAHLLGVTDIAAIGNANSVMFMMQSAIMGATMAANIMIAQQYGAGDLKMVKRIMGTAITFFVVISLILSLTGGLFAPHILTAMRTPAAAKAEAIIYLRVVFAAMPFMYFFQFLQMAQRGVGDSRTPFYFMAVAVGLDIILNPLLIAGIGPFPKLGIAGSATSTLVAQGLSLILLLIVLYRRHSVLMLRGRELRFLWPSSELLRPLIFRGIPMSLQMFIMSATGGVMYFLVNGFGAMTTGAYAGAVQIWNYIQMPGMAVGMSVSSMASQNVGAGQWARVDRVATVGLALSVAVTGTVALVIYALGPLPLYIFLPAEPKTIALALHIDRTVLWAFVIFNATFALSGVVRSTGAIWVPLIILIVSMIGVRIPFAVFLSHYFGADGLWWSFPMGTLTSSILTALYFRYGGWRKVRILGRLPAEEPPDLGQVAPAVETKPAQAAAS